MLSIDIPATPGVYRILNTVNGYCYIGSAINLRKRLRQHLLDLRRNAHANGRLQNAFNKYGEDTFVPEVLELVELKEDLIAREQHYLDLRKPEYNIRLKADSNLGTTRDEAARLRLSLSHKGKGPSPEIRAMAIAVNTGKPLSPERRAKIAKGNAGKKNSPAACAKMSITRKGRKPSAKNLARLKEVNTGTPRPPNVRAKISASHKGKKLSPKHAAAAAEGRRKAWEAKKKAKLVSLLVPDIAPESINPSDFTLPSLWG